MTCGVTSEQIIIAGQTRLIYLPIFSISVGRRHYKMGAENDISVWGHPQPVGFQKLQELQKEVAGPQERDVVGRARGGRYSDAKVQGNVGLLG